jgi:hypothetical protein
VQEIDPACTLTAGMISVVWQIAQALAEGQKAPDLTNPELLATLGAAPHDVDMVLKLLSRPKGHGIRVLLRVLVERQSLQLTGARRELRRAPAARLPTHLHEQGRVYAITSGDTVLRRITFRRDYTRPYEEC